jgi:hypothetical protein
VKATGLHRHAGRKGAAAPLAIDLLLVHCSDSKSKGLAVTMIVDDLVSPG